MAEERHVAAPEKSAKVVAKPAPKQTAAKAVTPPVTGVTAQLRADLATARRDLALQKLDSPAKIRKLRKDLARALTKENA